jgi:uncharacterized UPF0160 family protein
MNVVTHNSRFHADDVSSCYILSKLFPEAKVVRTRDEKIINAGHIVVDVGGIYDHDLNRYDHHQEEFDETFSDKHFVPLSSVGLIYRHYGKEYIKKMLNEWTTDEEVKKSVDLDYVYMALYNSIILETDALDNGILSYPEDTSLKYHVTTNLSNVVACMNDVNTFSEKQEHKFHMAMSYVGTVYQIKLESLFEKSIAYKKFKPIVDEAMSKRMDIHESGSIVVLPEECPVWWTYVMEFEHASKEKVQIMYVIHPSKDTWKICTLSKNFVPRKKLLSKSELSEKIEEEKIVFVHKNKFVGVAKDYDTALQMAVMSLESAEDE